MQNLKSNTYKRDQEKGSSYAQFHFDNTLCSHFILMVFKDLPYDSEGQNNSPKYGDASFHASTLNGCISYFFLIISVNDRM